MDKLYIELKGTIIALCIWAISCALTEFVSWLGLPNYCIALIIFVFVHNITNSIFSQILLRVIEDQLMMKGNRICASNPGQLTTLRKLNLNEVNQ